MYSESLFASFPSKIQDKTFEPDRHTFFYVSKLLKAETWHNL